jgi:hypothetical protein
VTLRRDAALVVLGNFNRRMNMTGDDRRADLDDGRTSEKLLGTPLSAIATR